MSGRLSLPGRVENVRRRDGGRTLVSVGTSLQQSTFKYTATDCNIYIYSSSDPIHNESKLLPGRYGYWIGCFHRYAHRKLGWPDIDVAGYYTFQPAFEGIQSERGSYQGYVAVPRFPTVLLRSSFTVTARRVLIRDSSMKRSETRAATHEY